MSNWPIHYSETKYKSVAALTTDDAGGSVIPNGQKVAVCRFRANGADPLAYVLLAWDWGGAAEKVIASTKGDIDLIFDSTDPAAQFTGDGVKKLQMIIINDNNAATPIVGGAYEVTKLA